VSGAFSPKSDSLLFASLASLKLAPTTSSKDSSGRFAKMSSSAFVDACALSFRYRLWNPA
jgi:hypothetical protein